MSVRDEMVQLVEGGDYDAASDYLHLLKGNLKQLATVRSALKDGPKREDDWDHIHRNLREAIGGLGSLAFMVKLEKAKAKK